MNNLKVARLLVLALAWFAPLWVTANSSFAKTTVSSVVVHDFGTAVLIQLASTPNTEGCVQTGYYVLEKSLPSFKEIYAAILLAYSTGTSVQGWVNGCNASLGYPTLTRIDLVK